MTWITAISCFPWPNFQEFRAKASFLGHSWSLSNQIPGTQTPQSNGPFPPRSAQSIWDEVQRNRRGNEKWSSPITHPYLRLTTVITVNWYFHSARHQITPHGRTTETTPPPPAPHPRHLWCKTREHGISGACAAVCGILPMTKLEWRQFVPARATPDNTKCLKIWEHNIHHATGATILQKCQKFKKGNSHSRFLEFAVFEPQCSAAYLRTQRQTI